MRRKKKIVTAVLVMLLAAGLFGISKSEAKAAAAAKLIVSSVKGYEGDTITVDVSVAENPGMCGLTFGLKYDKTVLAVKDAVAAGDIFSADDVMIQQEGDGYVGYMYAGIKDKTAVGKLLTVTFQIKDGAAIADSALVIGDVNGNIEASNFDGETVELTLEAGKVTVECKHVSTKEVEKTPVTCTTEGSVDTVCEKCGAVTKTEKKPALGHQYDAYATTKEPTCTEKGIEESVCSICKDKQTKEVAALGHKFGDFTITKEATDKQEGEAVSVCTVCGGKETVVLPKIMEKDFVIAGSDNKAFANEIVAGEETIITFAGIGMTNTSPKAGDVRYVPTSWKLDKETVWKEAPYTAAVKIAAAGSQELTAVYSRQIYNGAEWKADGKTVSVKTAIKVTEKTAANPGAATGEASEGAALLLMLCILSAGVITIASKEKMRV